MECLSPQEIAILGTAIALEMTKNKTKDQIKELKFLVAQILSTINIIYY